MTNTETHSMRHALSARLSGALTINRCMSSPSRLGTTLDGAGLSVCVVTYQLAAAVLPRQASKVRISVTVKPTPMMPPTSYLNDVSCLSIWPDDESADILIMVVCVSADSQLSESLCHPWLLSIQLIADRELLDHLVSGPSAAHPSHLAALLPVRRERQLEESHAD